MNCPGEGKKKETKSGPEDFAWKVGENNTHCKSWDLDLSDEGFWDSLLGRVCNRERTVLRQTSFQDFFSKKGRSETDPLGRVISESCLRSLEPRSRSQKNVVKHLSFWDLYHSPQTLPTENFSGGINFGKYYSMITD